METWIVLIISKFYLSYIRGGISHVGLKGLFANYENLINESVAQRVIEFRTPLALPRSTRYISLMGLWGTIIVVLDLLALISAASTMNSLKALLPFAGKHSIRRDGRRDSRSGRDGTILETNVLRIWSPIDLTFLILIFQ